MFTLPKRKYKKAKVAYQEEYEHIFVLTHEILYDRLRITYAKKPVYLVLKEEF